MSASNTSATKAPAASTDTGDLNAKIKKQVEYYFGDSNYPRDNHLRAQAALNTGGYISIAHLTIFNKLKALTTDVPTIAKALEGSDVVELSEDKQNVRRAKPLPETDTTTQRSIYSKYWPKETTREEVEKLYTPFGTILSIHMRTNKLTKDFKGTVIVEFSTEEEAKAALTAAPQVPNMTDKTAYMTKEAWLQEKQEQKQKNDAKYKEKREKKEQEKQEKEAEKLKQEQKPQEFVTGLILRIKEISTPDMSRETLNEIFGPFGKVVYTDFQKGDTEAHMRFESPDAAKAAIAALQDVKPKLGGEKVELSVPEGDEEKAYWAKVAEGSNKRKRMGDDRKGGRGGGRGRGGRGGGRGRGKKQRTK